MAEITDSDKTAAPLRVGIVDIGGRATDRSELGGQTIGWLVGGCTGSQLDQALLFFCIPRRLHCH